MEQREPVTREKQIEELEKEISKDTYTKKYMYGVQKLKEVIEKMNDSFEIRLGRSPVSMILFRIKTAESIAGKLEKKGYEITVENAEAYLNDLAGIRVVCALWEDVYLVDAFLHTEHDIRIIKRKDYIRYPKTSGYQSVHLIAELDVPVVVNGSQTFIPIRLEIQIRTSAMHFWAEKDHELYYKKRNNFS